MPKAYRPIDASGSPQAPLSGDLAAVKQSVDGLNAAHRDEKGGQSRYFYVEAVEIVHPTSASAPAPAPKPEPKPEPVTVNAADPLKLV